MFICISGNICDAMEELRETKGKLKVAAKRRKTLGGFV